MGPENLTSGNEDYDYSQSKAKLKKRRSFQVKIGLKRERKDKDFNDVDVQDQENSRQENTKSDQQSFDLSYKGSTSSKVKTNMRKDGGKSNNFFRKLLPFNRKFKRKNSFSGRGKHGDLPQSKSIECLANTSPKENGHKTTVTFAVSTGLNDVGKHLNETEAEAGLTVLRKDEHSNPVKIRESPKDVTNGVSFSTPNLTYVEWNSCESVSDEDLQDQEHIQDDSTYDSYRKRGSLRRSRASLVFPMFEVGDSSSSQVLGTALSERNLAKSRNSEVSAGLLKPTKSCIVASNSHDNFVDEFYRKYDDEIVTSKSKGDDRDISIVRTADRNSAQGGKSLPFHAFSLPEIYEDDAKPNANTDGHPLRREKFQRFDPIESCMTVCTDKSNSTSLVDKQDVATVCHDTLSKGNGSKNTKISHHSDRIRQLRGWLKRGTSLDEENFVLARQKEEERQQIFQFAKEIRSYNLPPRDYESSDGTDNDGDRCKCGDSACHSKFDSDKKTLRDFNYGIRQKEDQRQCNGDSSLNNNNVCWKDKSKLKQNYRHQRPFSLHEGLLFNSDVFLSDEEKSILERAQSFSVAQTIRKGSFGGIPRLMSNAEEYDPVIAEALWDHYSSKRGELNFSVGDMITVYCMDNSTWWWGAKDENTGWFPSSHVRLRVDQELEHHKIGLSADDNRNALFLLGLHGKSIMADKDDVRTKCIKELVNTERDYVKTLRDVIEGYLKNVRKKPDMFKDDDIRTIFGNIEQIYSFHKKFLRKMVDKISQTDPSESELGKLFLDHKSKFDIYSDYCNNHPHACARLLVLQQERKYKLFFEACRLLQHMISLSIDAFLLTPVQKICKYPLQLNELLKHTPVDHPDYEPLQAAVDAMKDVASSINEMKRKVEKLGNLAEWQLTVDGWEGGDVLERSSELIKKGTVERILSGKPQEIQIYLFDHQLILCRKDCVRRKGLVYEGRVDLDNASLGSADLCLDETNNVSLNNVLKITDDSESTSHLLCLKTTAEKEEWLQAFRDERSKAENDLKPGCAIPESVRKAAMDSARRKKQAEPKKEHRRRKSLTDPLFGGVRRESFDSATNAIRRSLRLRRTQSMRASRSSKKENVETSV